MACFEVFAFLGCFFEGGDSYGALHALGAGTLRWALGAGTLRWALEPYAGRWNSELGAGTLRWALELGVGFSEGCMYSLLHDLFELEI